MSRVEAERGVLAAGERTLVEQCIEHVSEKLCTSDSWKNHVSEGI